jgi:hypothetical protein
MELTSEAVNEGRLEGNHDPPANRIVSAVYCLNEVRRSTFEMRSYQRQPGDTKAAQVRRRLLSECEFTLATAILDDVSFELFFQRHCYQVLTPPGP